MVLIGPDQAVKADPFVIGPETRCALLLPGSNGILFKDPPDTGMKMPKFFSQHVCLLGKSRNILPDGDPPADDPPIVFPERLFLYDQILFICLNQ